MLLRSIPNSTSSWMKQKPSSRLTNGQKQNDDMPHDIIYTCLENFGKDWHSIIKVLISAENQMQINFIQDKKDRN